MRYPLTVSLLIVLAAAFALIGYDVWLYSRGGTEATISWHLWEESLSTPLVPFLFGLIVGILAGHFFWQMCACK